MKTTHIPLRIVAEPMAVAAAARLIEIATYQLWVSLLRDNRSENENALHAAMSHPKVGDLVMEQSSFQGRSYRRDGVAAPRTTEGIGRLIRIADEPLYTLTEWIDQGGAIDEAIPTERAYYIALVFDDGREFRWVNASFLAVPEKYYGM